MTSQYSHGGHGWNQKLREAVGLLETTYTLSYNVSYDTLPGNQPTEKKVANPSSHQGKEWWWSPRDLNPCFSHTAASPFFIARLVDFVPLIHR